MIIKNKKGENFDLSEKIIEFKDLLIISEITNTSMNLDDIKTTAINRFESGKDMITSLIPTKYKGKGIGISKGIKYSINT